MITQFYLFSVSQTNPFNQKCLLFKGESTKQSHLGIRITVCLTGFRMLSDVFITEGECFFYHSNDADEIAVGLSFWGSNELLLLIKHYFWRIRSISSSDSLRAPQTADHFPLNLTA